MPTALERVNAAYVRAHAGRRVTEGIAEKLVSTGGGVSSHGLVDPVDGDRHYRAAGRDRMSREMPFWTRERARDYSVTAYRSNPMATAIIDTFVAFCVGDSGVSPTCTNPDVKVVVDDFWNDPANRLGKIQEISLRSQLLLGEKLYELLQGEGSGVVRFCPIEPARIKDVVPRAGNPLWPGTVVLPPLTDEQEDDQRWRVAAVNDESKLREGQCMFWAPFRTLDTDIRGYPFLMPVLDWLENYDLVLSNAIDRTALARFFALHAKITGDQADVDAWVDSRGGTHIPPSGSVEVTDDRVELKPLSVPTGIEEDSTATKLVLTTVAAGAGLARTWLADPEDANRATSLTMAEPVRRRVGGIQRVWLDYQTELVRFAVDRAVAAGRLSSTVESTDPRTGDVVQVPASETVFVDGPEVAAADAQITAGVLLNVATGLEKLQAIGALSPDAVAAVARKAWEDFMGVPFRAELAGPGASPDDVATEVQAAESRRGLLALAK